MRVKLHLRDKKTNGHLFLSAVCLSSLRWSMTLCACICCKKYTPVCRVSAHGISCSREPVTFKESLSLRVTILLRKFICPEDMPVATIIVISRALYTALD